MSYLAAFEKAMTKPSSFNYESTSEQVGLVKRSVSIDRDTKQVTRHSLEIFKYDTDEAGGFPYLASFEAGKSQYLEGPFSKIGKFIRVVYSVNARSFEEKKEAAKGLGELLYGATTVRGTKWYPYVAYDSPGDKEVVILMTAEPIAERLGCLSALGIDINMSSASAGVKVSKRFRRLFGSHMAMWFGQLTELKTEGKTVEGKVRMQHPQLLTFRAQPSVCDANGRSFQDGSAKIRLGAVRQLFAAQPELIDKVGMPHVGDGLPLTVLAPGLNGKGHIIVVDHNSLDVDLVIYDQKVDLKGSFKNFTIGMGYPLHSSNEVNADLQSVLNFNQEPLLVPLVEKAYLKARDEFMDESVVFDGLLRQISDPASLNLAWDPEVARGTYRIRDLNKATEVSLLKIDEPVDTWLPSRMARVHQEYPELGLDKFINRIPAAARALSGAVLTRLKEMALQGNSKKRLAIPLGDDVFSGYLMELPESVDKSGKTVVSRCPLKPGQAYFRGMTGMAILHRNPNGVPGKPYIPGKSKEGQHGECVCVMLVANPDLEEQYHANSPFVMVHPQTLAEICEVMGGGDLDDRVVVYTGDEWVKHFFNLPAPGIAPAAPESRPTPLVGKTKDGKSAMIARISSGYRTFTYTPAVVMSMAEKSMNAELNLGAAVSRCMLFTQMQRLMSEDRKFRKEYEGVFSLARVRAATEKIVDAAVQGDGDVTWAKEDLDNFDKSLNGKRLPLWTKAKFSRWTVTEKFRASGFIETPLDGVIAAINSAIECWQEFRLHWQSDSVVDTFHLFPGHVAVIKMMRHCSSKEAVNLAKTIRRIWAGGVKPESRKSNKLQFTERAMDIHRKHLIGVYLDGGIEALENEKVAFRKYRDARRNKLFMKASDKGLAAFMPHRFTNEDTQVLCKRNEDFRVLFEGDRALMTEEDKIASSMIVGMAYESAQFEIYQAFRHHPFIHQAMCLLWHSTYSKVVKYEDGTPVDQMSNVGDGLLWGADMAALTLKALIWAHKSSKDMIDPDDTTPPDFTLDRGEFGDDPAIEAEHDLSPAELEEEVDGLKRVILVNGFWRQGFTLRDQEVIDWKNLLRNQVVMLKATLWQGKKAVAAYLGDNPEPVAWVDERQAQEIYRKVKEAGGIKALVQGMQGIKMMAVMC